MRKIVRSATVGLEHGETRLDISCDDGSVGTYFFPPALAESVARDIAHTTEHPWRNRSPYVLHCPRHPTRLIVAGDTCDTCLEETQPRTT